MATQEDINIPVLKGCCPLGFNCFKETGNRQNYYPGNCPNWDDCLAYSDEETQRDFSSTNDYDF